MQFGICNPIPRWVAPQQSSAMLQTAMLRYKVVCKIPNNTARNLPRNLTHRGIFCSKNHAKWPIRLQLSRRKVKILIISLMINFELLLQRYIFILLRPPKNHKNHVEGTFRTQYTAYRTHQFRLFGAEASLLLIQDSSRLTCSCGSHSAHVPRQPTE